MDPLIAVPLLGANMVLLNLLASSLPRFSAMQGEDDLLELIAIRLHILF
jgi:hypothetical protein